ncbi:MAG: hypothetical protein KC635_24435, partial [Myxococcales bacterium]|nr:hypothetical protein [Myxococcales bacterium]
ALDEGAGAARKAADADTRKAWVRLAATPPIEVQKAEAKLEGSVQGVAGDKRREAIGAFLRNQPELLKQFMTGPKAEVALTTAVAWFYRRLDEARPGENDDKAKWQVRRARMQSLAGSLEHQGVKLTITLSEIKGHANPDQDGAYANVKVAKAASKGVSAPWLRVFSVKNAGVLLDTLAAAVPALFATGAGVDKAIDVATRVVAALRKPARALDTTLGAEAGGEVSFEQHLVFEGATWRTQFRRVQLSGQASASLKTPGPAGSTVTAKVGMAGAVTLVEQIGVDTLSYVKTAYDGFRNRGESATDPRFTGPWGAFVTGRLKPRLKLLAERVATPGTNARREAAGTAFLTACDGKKGEAELVTALEADFEAAFVKTQRDPNQGKAPDEMWRDLPRLSSAEAYKLMADPGKMATLPARQLAELVELSLSRWVSSWRDQVPLVNVLIAARRSGQEVALVTAVDFMRLYRGLSWASWKQVAPLLGSRFLARVEQGKRDGYVALFVRELPPSPAHFGIWRNDNIVAALKSLPRLDATQVLRKIRPSVVYHALAGQGSLWGQELFEHTRVREDEERRPQVRR